MSQTRITALLLGLVLVGLLGFVQNASADTGQSCQNYVGQLPAGEATTCEQRVTATDPEADNIYYVFHWQNDGFATRVPQANGSFLPGSGCSRPVVAPGVGLVPSGTTCWANFQHTQANQSPGWSTFATAWDEAGHESAASAILIVKILAAVNPGPTLGATPASSGGWISDPSTMPIQLTATDADGVAEARYRWNADAGPGVGTVYLNNDEIDMIPGSNNLFLWGKDSLGAENTAGPFGPYRYDDTNPTVPGAPTCTSAQHPNGHSTNGVFACTWTVSVDTQSGMKSYQVYQSLNGGLPTYVATVTLNSWSSAGRSEGRYRYKAWAFDNVDRNALGPESADVYVDATPPLPNPLTLSALSSTKTTITWQVPVANDGSGIGLHTTAPYGFAPEVGGAPGTFSWVAVNTWVEGDDEPPLTCSTSYRRYGAARDVLLNQRTSAMAQGTTLACGSPPHNPANPDPASTAPLTLRKASTQLSWRTDGSSPGYADPDSGNTVTYSVYLREQGAPVFSLNGTSVKAWNAVPPYAYTPSGNPFTPGHSYDWKVVAVDSPTNLTNPTSAVWSFKVNTPPSLSGLLINPTTVSTDAVISWTYADADGAAQTYKFNLYYNTSAGLGGATPIAANLTATAASCSGGSCSWAWSNPDCLPEGSFFLLATVNDGEETSAPAGVAPTVPFSLNHTRTVYSPGPSAANFTAAVDGQLAVAEGSIKTDTPVVVFKGACSITKNPQVQVNSGTPARYNGSLGPGVVQTNPALWPPSGLIPNCSNQLTFTFKGCGQADYRIQYDLVNSCSGQAYVSVDQGSIYSRENIRAKYAPPAGAFNARYLVLGGGTSGGGERQIDNFVAGPAPSGLQAVNPNFGSLTYPSGGDTGKPEVGSFDYYGLTHTIAGDEIKNSGTNLYGHGVEVIKGNKVTSQELDTPARNPLRGRVYRFTGNLTVDRELVFQNAAAGERGSGLVIVDGDLTIENNMSYAPTGGGTSARGLASVGWLVRGNLIVRGQVERVVGAYYVSGTGTGGGSFTVEPGSLQLTIYGALIARRFDFGRTYYASPGPTGTEGAAERVVADGRVLINTPPGFSDILRALPTWQLRAPTTP